MLGRRLQNIIVDDAVVHPDMGRVVMEEPEVMRVCITECPQTSCAFSLRKFEGGWGGLRAGKWSKTCDYMMTYSVGNQDVVYLIELKRSRTGVESGLEQLRRTMPLVTYLKSLSEVDATRTKKQVGLPRELRIVYVLLFDARSSRFEKQSLRGNPSAGKETYLDITAYTFSAKCLKFGQLRRLN